MLIAPRVGAVAAVLIAGLSGAALVAQGCSSGADAEAAATPDPGDGASLGEGGGGEPGDAAPKDPVFPDAHPRIYVNAANRARLTAALKEGSAPAARFRTMVDGQVAGADHYDFQPSHAALMGVLTGTPSYCDYAIGAVDDFVTRDEADIAASRSPSVARDSYLDIGGLVGNLALTYDWCFDRVTAARRQRWLALANQAVWNVWHHEEATWAGRKVPWSGWSVDNPSNNYYYSFLRATMLLGLAARNEHPEAAGWITHFRDTKLRDQLVPKFKADLAGGGSREGTGYGVAMAGLFELYALWEASTGEKVSALTDHARASLAAMVHAIVPTLDRLAPTGDHARDSSASLFDYHRNYLQILVHLFPNDPVASRAKALLAASSVPRMSQYFMFVSDFLYDEPALVAAPLAGLAPAYFAPGAGQIYARSSWDKSAAWLSLMAGPYSESHAHRDQGSLMLFKNEWLAYDQNVLSKSGIRQEEELHNLVRIVRAGATVPMREGAPAAAPYALVDNARWMHAGIDVTPVYDGNAALSKSERETVFVKPGCVVVFDRIDAASDAQRIFQLNSPLLPSTAGARATFAGTKSTLVVDRVAPAGAPAGLTTSVIDWKTDADMNGGYRLEVRDAAAGGRSRFLHVLSLDGAVTSAAPSDQGTLTGVDITLAGGAHALVRFETNGRGGTLELRSAGGAVIESGPLATTVVPLPVLTP